MPGAPRTDPGVQFSRTGLLALNFRYFRTRRFPLRSDTASLTGLLPLFTMLVIRAAYQRGLSYPLTARLPARSLRRSLCRPCWMQGICTRLSRAQTTMNRSDSLVLIPICSASVSLLRIPRQTGRGGARASHVSHVSLTTCHALGLRRLTNPVTPVFF